MTLTSNFRMVNVEALFELKSVTGKETEVMFRHFFRGALLLKKKTDIGVI